MKKVISWLILGLFVICSGGLPQPTGQSQAKPEDLLKNLVLVEKVAEVPAKMKIGLESIKPKESLAMLTYLASDLLEGRETGTRGYQLAAEYVASLFSLWNIQPAGDRQTGLSGRFSPLASDQAQAQPQRSYFQEVVLKEIAESSSQIVVETRKGDLVKTRTFTGGIDYSSLTVIPETVSGTVVFAGYGITEKDIAYDDFKNLDVKDKIVLIISEAPGKDNPNSPFQKKELKEKYFPPESPLPMMRQPAGRFNKIEAISKLGPAAILQVANTTSDLELIRSFISRRRTSDDRPIDPRPRRRMVLPGGGPTMPFERSPVINITREMANAILESTGQTIDELKAKIEKTFKPASMSLPATRVTIKSEVKASLVRCFNVLGYIEGSDAKLKEEVILIGAHMDHLGAFDGYVFNGADDNGSGTVGVLNVARAMVLNPEKPKRTVVFALWTGEEKGLLGSRYYVRHPAFPLEKTVAYLNLDMIRRTFDEASLSRMTRMFNFPSAQDLLKKIRADNFLPISFSAGSGIADVLKQANQYVGLDLWLRESTSEGRTMGGSDHASFAAEKIPWLFANTAMTSDYHQTSDSVDKVSGELMAKISRLIYLTAYLLADK
ncbi:MAG: M20/M25/M40 family metallo-hydrolase [Candidatus Aminicenantes bacterium]|nr:M20/M25/M40 family metallo-hydrolase [Candidatus Aminicenantes bacterium]